MEIPVFLFKKFSDLETGQAAQWWSSVSEQNESLKI
jgi:hypothetical protein